MTPENEIPQTFFLSDEDIVKINQAKRYAEDPGSPLSEVSARIEKAIESWKASEKTKTKSA